MRKIIKSAIDAAQVRAALGLTKSPRRGRPRRSAGEPSEETARKFRNHYVAGKKCMQLSPTDSAYIAGLIDGEGCVGLYWRTKPSSKGPRKAHNFVVAVHMSDREPIDFICKATGLCATRKMHSPARKAAGEKPQYVFACSSDGAATLLEQILPYLRIGPKRKKAELLIELQRQFREGEIMPKDMELPPSDKRHARRSSNSSAYSSKT